MDGRGAPRLAPWQVRLVGVLLALALTTAALAVYLNAARRPPLPGASDASGSPFLLFYEQVGQGHVNLTLPLMEASTPDNASVTSIRFSSYMGFSSGTAGTSEVNYTWMGESDSGMPVVIAYDSPWPGFSAGPNWLNLKPGGSCVDSCSMHIGWSLNWSNVTMLALQEFAVPYTVYRATLVQPERSYSWLEVRYELGSSTIGACEAGAYCWAEFDATYPAPEDLEVIGPPLIIHVDSVAGQVTPFDVHDWVDPARIFHTTFPGPTFDAGVYGGIRTTLRSSFAWGSASDETFSIIGAGNLTMEMAIDTRFGSLHPVLLP